jgi:hypothetical protein
MIRAVILLAFLAAPAAADEPYRVKQDIAKPPREVAEAIASLLDGKALAVHRGEATIAEIWLRGELPSSADADQIKNGLTYREIPETTLLGVVRFPKAFIDYRKQQIPAGVYSLRLAVQPDTGDHKDTAPYQDFALLVPIAKEANADTMDAKDLIKLSRAVLGGDHPAPMLLFPAKKAKKEPAIVDHGDGVMTLDVLRTVNVNGTTATIGLAIAVAGSSKSR